MPASLSKAFRRIAIVLAVAVVLWLGSSYSVAYRLTRRPHALCEETLPALSWGTVAPLRLPTCDGEELGAWHALGETSRPIVLLLHGNGRDRSSCVAQAELLHADGCSVLMISLRAHGDSTGDTNDFGFGARHDVTAAVEWLETHHPSQPIVIWGCSLGSAAALFAAGELGQRVKGYVLECPYRDLRTAVRNRTRHYLPPVIDWIAFTGLLFVSDWVIPDLDAISPLEAASAMPKHMPVLLLAGGKDRRAFPAEAKEIAERIGAMAELVTIADGDHAELFAADPERYRAVILGFIRKCR
jgi:alpha-beta hydrolase superfamily lysophospholipase